MRGKTLGELVTDFRDEAGLASTSALSQNVLEAIKTKLRRTQEVLYADWAWPFLRMQRDELLKAGERYYTLPPELDPDRLEGTKVRETTDSTWRPVLYGIDMWMRNDCDAELDERRDPVCAWEYYEGNQYEVWPMPATNTGVLRFTGMQRLPPLRSDADRAVLDDRLIVLYAAGEWLQRAKDPSAQTVLSMADAHYRRVKGNTQRQRVFPIAAGQPVPWVPITIKAPGT
jgi:hypothetical protein